MFDTELEVGQCGSLNCVEADCLGVAWSALQLRTCVLLLPCVSLAYSQPRYNKATAAPVFFP